MPYKTGSWGEQAKMRAERRRAWFGKYNEKRDPLKKEARKIVDLALRKGILVRGKCRVCGSAKGQAHHEDYTKPLEVVWLCVKHHRELHHPQKPCLLCGKTTQARGMCPKHYLQWWHGQKKGE